MNQRRMINVVRYGLENLVPPFIRENPSLMAIPMRLVFGSKAKFVMEFKSRAFSMSESEMADVYREIRGCSNLIRGATDLNSKCLARILADVRGCSDLLEVGCGNGFLAGRLAAVVPEVTAADIYLDPDLPRCYPSVRFATANLEHLQFPDSSFDFVIATHTLEHLQRPRRAIEEMRRVAKSAVIVVVPCERPYRYTFNLHLQFFPYKESLLYALDAPPDHVCELLDGDLYYFEGVAQAGSAHRDQEEVSSVGL